MGQQGMSVCQHGQLARVCELCGLQAENERLAEALRLANIDALNNEAEANELKAKLTTAEKAIRDADELLTAGYVAGRGYIVSKGYYDDKNVYKAHERLRAALPEAGDE